MHVRGHGEGGFEPLGSKFAFTLYHRLIARGIEMIIRSRQVANYRQWHVFWQLEQSLLHSYEGDRSD
jgi:hypothetical protein